MAQWDDLTYLWNIMEHGPFIVYLSIRQDPTVWFARKVRMEFKYYPKRRAQKPAQGQCFDIYQTTNPKP